MNALSEEDVFNIGDHVRVILNRQTFQRGTLSKWSKTVHTIITSSPHSYTLDNGKNYKYYELQKVNQVNQLQKQTQEPTREKMQEQITKQRRFKKSGLDKENILTSKRQRIPTDKFSY